MSIGNDAHAGLRRRPFRRLRCDSDARAAPLRGDAELVRLHTDLRLPSQRHLRPERRRRLFGGSESPRRLPLHGSLTESIAMLVT
jgi:hypothetical protein